MTRNLTPIFNCDRNKRLSKLLKNFCSFHLAKALGMIHEPKNNNQCEFTFFKIEN